MKEVSVTRCNMNPEMGKSCLVLEHEGRLICLREVPWWDFLPHADFNADSDSMCWMTEFGESMEMTAAEKKITIREIRKWCKKTRRPNKKIIRFYSGSKGIFKLDPKSREKISGVIALFIIIALFAVFAFAGYGIVS